MIRFKCRCGQAGSFDHYPYQCPCGILIQDPAVVRSGCPSSSQEDLDEEERYIWTADAPCVHRGSQLRLEECGCVRRNTLEAVYECSIHEECSYRKIKAGGIRTCLGCDTKKPPEPA